MKINLGLFSPKIVFVFGNNELLSHFRVYKKSATNPQTDEVIMGGLIQDTGRRHRT